MLLLSMMVLSWIEIGGNHQSSGESPMISEIQKIHRE
jgi:hypothetical protein